MADGSRLLHIEDPMHPQKFSLAVQNFNNYEKFTDICFVCAKGVKVKAHKLLLCSMSNFLKSILMSVPEFVLHDVVVINVPDIDSGTMHLLMDFLYEGFIKVTEADYTRVTQVMNTLGIVLQNNEKPKAPVVSVPPQPTVAPQVVYVPTTNNSQGQMQYVMATQQTTATGSPMLMTQPSDGQLMSPVVQQPQIMISQPNTGQMVLQQPTTTPSHSNIIMAQPNGQMIQGTPQVMQTQVQQNNYTQQMATNVTLVNNQPGVPAQTVLMNNNLLQSQDNYQVSQQGSQQQQQQQRLQPHAPIHSRTPQTSRGNSIVRGRRVMRGLYPVTQTRPGVTMNRTIQRQRMT